MKDLLGRRQATFAGPRRPGEAPERGSFENDPAQAEVRVTINKRGPTKKRWAKHVVLWGGRLLLLLLVLGSWQLFADDGIVNVHFTGLPTKIVGDLADGLVHGGMLAEIGITLEATAIGFLIGALLAIPIALLFTEVTILDKIVSPFLTAFNSTPRIALAPLFILWFGLGTTGAVAATISFVFFIVLANTMAGFHAVNRDHMLIARLYAIGRWRRFRLFVWPAAIPMVFAGFQLGLVYGILGTVGEEMLGGSRGLGAQLMTTASTFHMNQFFAGLLALMLLTVLLSQGMKSLEASLALIIHVGR